VEILIGLITGLLVGLTGLGGGVLLLPVLIFGLGVSPLTAVGSDAVFNALTKIGAGFLHWRQGKVDWGLVRWLAGGSVPGAVIGVLLVQLIRATHGDGVNQFLRTAVGILLVVIPVLLLLEGRIAGLVSAAQRERMSARRRIAAIGLGAGVLVGMTSVGSGSIVMMLLLLFVNASPATLVGTDIVHGVLLTGVTGAMHFRFGNVDTVLVLELLAGSVPGALIGARLSAIIPGRLLRYVLCLLLAVSGARLLLARMPAQQGQRIAVHGHRGARLVLPENTLPAFEHAIEAGADYIELDLAATRDNVLVVSHDPVLPEALCRGPEGTRTIREMKLAELRRWDCGSMVNPAFPLQKPAPGARVPTLDQVLDLAGRGSFRFNIETKVSELAPPPEEFARLVVEAVRRHKLESRVMVQSFDYRTLAATKELAPEIPLAALVRKREGEYVEAARRAGAQIAAPEFSLISRESVAEAHRAGLKVVPWTANRPEDWDRLIAAGVDGIITDDPAALVAHLRSRGLR
jgi:glycerophosphoryl diester phosphodiesterase